MQYYTHIPNQAWSRWIEEIIYFRGFEPDHSIERLVPTGHPSIICALDGMPRHTFDNESLKPNSTLHDIWLYGMHRTYLSISAHPLSEMLVLRFATPGARPFFYERLDRFSDLIIPGPDALGGALLSLHSALTSAPDAQTKFQAVEHWLSQRFRAELCPPPAILSIVAELQKAPATHYARISEGYPRSQKDLIEQFKKHVGLTPKYYHRLLRFADIFKALQGGEPPPWAEIALQCGYTDQSHFVREFRHFSGFTPEQFRKAGFDLDAGNYFPIDSSG